MIWDYIIIGAGSSGCALAYQLAKSGREPSILILEAGGPDNSPLIKLPAAQPQMSLKYDWGYQSQPDPTRNGANEKWKRGRVVGGSSSINGMLYVRAAAEDFSKWAEFCGNRGGWSPSEIIPIFREFETSDQDGPLRGHDGPLHVTTVKHPHLVTKAFVQSACAAGYPYNEDYNGETQYGVAYMQRSLRKGLRCSAADAFLKPILRQKNVTLITGALVEKIEVENGRAEAVSFVHGQAKQREAGRNIILCAGAINSPQILMLSGIGDPDELARHNIRTLIRSPEVGRNLKDHPLTRVTFRSKVQTYNLTGGLLQKLGFVAKFLRYREGPISVIAEGTAFLNTTSSPGSPDIQIYFAPIGIIGKLGAAFSLAPFPSFMMYVTKQHPVSRGQIRLANSDPGAAPLIECRMLAEQEDVDTLVRGVRTVRRIMKTEPIASLIESELHPGAEFESDAVLENFVRSHTEVSAHPCGTCRMGDDAGSVVDPYLRVRGTENLWVADASIMPDHVSANLNSVCIMIGTKLGKQLVAAPSPSALPN